jgi:hypothetical protein
MCVSITPVKSTRASLTEYNLALLLPNFCHQSLTRVDDTSEPEQRVMVCLGSVSCYLPDFDILQLPIVLVYMLAGNTHEAESVKDGLVEPSNSRKFR